MILTEKAVKEVQNNKQCKNWLAVNLDKDPSRILYYLKNNNQHPNHVLTTKVGIDTILEFTPLKEKEILIDEKSLSKKKSKQITK